jgi:hypothetical protein
MSIRVVRESSGACGHVSNVVSIDKLTGRALLLHGLQVGHSLCSEWNVPRHGKDNDLACICERNSYDPH